MKVIKSKDSVGDRIFEVVQGRKKIAMFRHKEEAEQFVQFRKDGRSFTGVKLKSANNSMRRNL